MNAPGEIRRLTAIADPDAGLITNVTAAHLEKLHSVEAVAKAKGEMFEEEDGFRIWATYSLDNTEKNPLIGHHGIALMTHEDEMSKTE